MGYLVTAHVFPVGSELDRLGSIPKSIGYRVYHHEKAGLLVMDTFRAARIPEYPFQTMLPTVDVSLDLPEQLADLETIYAFLRKSRMANGMKKSYINFCLSLSETLESRVLSFASDDDVVDFACEADRGSLTGLTCMCGDLLITYKPPTCEIQPLLPESEDDEEFLTNVRPLEGVSPRVRVLARNVDWPTELHHCARSAFKRFSRFSADFLGLGSFDPPTDESSWRPIASRSLA